MSQPPQARRGRCSEHHVLTSEPEGTREAIPALMVYEFSGGGGADQKRVRSGAYAIEKLAVVIGWCREENDCRGFFA